VERESVVLDDEVEVEVDAGPGAAPDALTAPEPGGEAG